MYTVGDFLIRLKNAARAHREEVVVPYARMSEAIARTLLQEGYVGEVRTDKEKKMLTVVLAYRGKEPMLTNLKVLSRPGLRVYKTSSELTKQAKELGFAIVSTPKGIVTDKEARKQHLGGEVIARVW